MDQFAGTAPHITGTVDHFTGITDPTPPLRKRNERNEMMLFLPPHIIFLTEMVHFPHHDLNRCQTLPLMLDHFHRNRWTTSPEYAQQLVTFVKSISFDATVLGNDSI